MAHLQQQKSRLHGTSWQKLQVRLKTKAGEEIKKLVLAAAHYYSRVPLLTHRLTEMIRQEQKDRQWLHTVDDMLVKLPETNRQIDRKWLENQQVLVAERLEKNGKLAQAKLEIQIELAKAKSAINNVAVKKLKKEMK